MFNSTQLLACGYTFLLWGLIDRPTMMIIAALMIFIGYAMENG